MKTFLILAGVAFAIMLLLAGGAIFYFLKSTLRTPLESASAGKPAMPLPKDAIVLTVADGAEVVAPFLIHDESGAVGGIAAFQPKGSRTDEHSGKVKFSAKIQDAGIYIAWVHAKWRDTCSNSCSLKVAEGTDFTVGNDDVFNVWHWVPASKHTFAAGDNPVTISEREDGIFFDQILFTKDAAYVPTGAITTAGVLRDIRRFADTFSRSPGHGNEGWEFEGKGKFEVAFSFDPNRIPNQYALAGDAKDGPCYAFVKGAPWYGCKVSFSFMPTSDGEYGCLMEKNGDDNGLPMAFVVKDNSARVIIGSRDPKLSGADVKNRLRLNQWHRVVVERWAWVTRVWVDGKEVAHSIDILPKAGKSGLFVSSGTAVFDDFEIEEIPWMADDGNNFKIDWSQASSAKWFRESDETGSFLRGESGEIKAGFGGIPLEEVDLERAFHPEAKNSAAIPDIYAPGLKKQSDLVDVYRLPVQSEGSCTHAAFRCVNPGDSFRRVALRFGRRTPQTYNVGPYTFSSHEMDDPSDYLDFTEEEYRKMAERPDAMKLARQAKIKPIIGHGGEDDEGPWAYMGGYWNIDTREGCLKGRGAGARLRHSQEISSDMEMRFKVRLADSSSTAEVELYAGADAGLRVQLTPQAAKPAALPPGVAMSLDVKADDQWHEVTLRIDASKLSAKLDRAPLQEATFARGDGDRIYLKIMKGAADFDDIEFVVQRATDKSVLYAFNQPEPDWWREPAEKWIDHGGIACVLASSWVSLVAPDSRATMWNKRAFSPNALVAFNVEENTDWRGWDKHPSHIHFPFENIETSLANEKDPAICYTLTVNAEQHSATLLFRNGIEVARVRQDRKFPLRFIGSHMPFLPRVNRVCLIKRGGLLRGIVNGKEVLTFTDPQPLDVSKVGIGGHDTRINFSHIEIVNLAADSLQTK